jgi:hypothetical protein
MQHLLRILDEGQAKGPDRRARHQIADHRAETEPLEDRHRDHGGAEKDRGTGQKRALAYRHLPFSPTVMLLPRGPRANALNVSSIARTLDRQAGAPCAHQRQAIVALVGIREAPVKRTPAG